MEICMMALKEVSKVWLVAKMVHTLFESILGNKHLEERLQRAAGNRHKKRPAQKQQTAPPSPPAKEQSHKRKYDEVDAPFSNGAPAPQMSYERSRPQTPAITPSREMPPQQSGQSNLLPVQETGELPRHDAFMGNSRSVTRMGSPALDGPGLSYPSTPPDLFLVTRNSPTIPEDLWNNFQPDQLFPADTNLNVSPPTNPSMIDPQLASTQHVPPTMQSPPRMDTTAMTPQQQQVQMQQAQGSQQQAQQHPQQQPQAMPQQYQQHPHQHQQQMAPYPPQMAHLQPNGALPQQQMQSPHSWAQVGAMNARPQLAPEDTWSNSSMSGQAPIVPTTLNVEEW